MMACETVTFTEMMAALQQLDQHLEPATVSKFWQRGVKADDAFADMVDHAPPEAMAWYAWHGGVDMAAAVRAYREGRPASISISPDGLIHQGRQAMRVSLKHLLQHLGMPLRFEDGTRLFPIGTIREGLACLRQVPDTDVWRLAYTHQEYDFRPCPFPVRLDDGWITDPTTSNRRRSLESSPTLLEYVEALNQGFDAGTLKIKGGKVWTSIIGRRDLNPTSYPWTWR